VTKSAAASYTVLYASGGTCDGAPGHQVLPPIATDGSTVAKQGSTVPVKFRVCDAKGASIGTPGVVTAFVSTGSKSGGSSGAPTVYSTTPYSTFRWDPTDQLWIFNLSTSNLAAGDVYFYRISLSDGSFITFQFAVK
jgi:hypothetical protein